MFLEKLPWGKPVKVHVNDEANESREVFWIEDNIHRSTYKPLPQFHIMNVQ